MRSHQPVSLVIEPVSLISQGDPTSLMTWTYRKIPLKLSDRRAMVGDNLWQA